MERNMVALVFSQGHSTEIFITLVINESQHVESTFHRPRLIRSTLLNLRFLTATKSVVSKLFFSTKVNIETIFK